MDSQDRQIRVFISSTFRDMQAERDHLVTVVFPELRERVEQLGLEFFDVDLRWGVPAKDANGETANSWEYCRQWIDRVEPFFVCILGQRYGWVPEPEQLKAREDSLRQQLEKRSITDMEVRHAVFNTNLKRRSYFYLRASDAPATDSEYVDPPPLLSKLEQLKNEARSCGRPVRDYPCRWTGSGFAGMEEFGRQVLEDLWSGVLRDERYVGKDIWRHVLGTDPDTDPRYTDENQPIPCNLWEKIIPLAQPVPVSPLDAECQQMNAFAASRLRWFQGRTNELQQLTDFLQSTAVDAPQLAIVVAEAGQGKSALLSHLHEQLKSSQDLVITHFVGATEHSASAHALLERLLDELDRSGIAWPVEEQKEGDEPKRDFNSLCLRLAQRLGNYAGERRIVVILDALNQLSDGHNLQWLPYSLGPQVRIIVSCVDDAFSTSPSPDGRERMADRPGEGITPEQRILHALASRQPAPLRVPLGPLTEADVRTIVVAFLKEYCHELDREHLEMLCAIPHAHNPLYLLVMLNELRTLGGNDLNRIVPERIASMPQDHPDTVSLFRWVLQRLEVFGTEAVRWWCLYLAHGRVGMASHELADLLACKLGADAAATALRIERGLRRYLQRRGPQIDFFHGQLHQAVLEQYSPQAEAATVHSDIATYFYKQDNFLESIEDQRARARRLPPTPRFANRRKVEELVYQLLNVLHKTPPETSEFVQACETLENLLTDIFFLEAKTEAGLAFEIAREFSEVVSALPFDRPRRTLLSLLERALRHDLNFIASFPTHFFQCLWNSAWWHGTTGIEKYYYNYPEERQATSLSYANAPIRVEIRNLLESWQAAKTTLKLQTPYLKSMRPPRYDLASSLLFQLRLPSIGPLACSPDGSLIVLGTSDGAVLVWDVSSQLLVRTWQAHNGSIFAIAFSPDGCYLATSGKDGKLKLWNRLTLGKVGEMDLVDGSTAKWWFSTAGDKLLVQRMGHLLKITVPELRLIDGTDLPVVEEYSCRAVSLDGDFMVYGLKGGEVVAVETVSGVQTHRIQVDDSPPEYIAVIPGGMRALVFLDFSADCGALLVDFKTSACHRVPLDYDPLNFGNRCCHALSSDGSAIAHSSDFWLRIVDTATGKVKPIRSGERCSWVGCSNSGDRVFTASDDVIYVYDNSPDNAEWGSLLGGDEGFLALEFSPSGRHLASCGRECCHGINTHNNQNLRVFIIDSTEPLIQITLSGFQKTLSGWVPGLYMEDEEVRSVEWINDVYLLITIEGGVSRSEMVLVDVRNSGRLLRTFQHVIARAPSSGILAMLENEDGRIRIVDCLRDTELCVLDGDTAVFDDRANSVAVYSQSRGLIGVFGLDGKELLTISVGHENTVESLHFVEGWLVAHTNDVLLRIFEVGGTRHREFALICPGMKKLRDVRLSSDGRYALSIVEEGETVTVSVWATSMRHPLWRRPCQVRQCFFTSDGQQVVVVKDGGKTEAFDVETGEPIGANGAFYNVATEGMLEQMIDIIDEDGVTLVRLSNSQILVARYPIRLWNIRVELRRGYFAGTDSWGAVHILKLADWPHS